MPPTIIPRTNQRLAQGQRLLLALGLTVLLALAGCQASPRPTPAPLSPQQAAGLAGGATAPATAAATAAPVAAPEQSAYPTAKIEANQGRAKVGATIVVKGSSFPANVPVALTWKTFDGRYLLEQDEVVYVGPRYEERLTDLGKATSDANGLFQTTFTVPEDFGGIHDIIARVDGKFATKMGFSIIPSFSVSPTTGPVGTPIEVTATGLGWRQQESMWEVSWNNGFTGYLTAVNTRGTATARMRMAGPTGKHLLKIWRNYRGIPYLNPHQGPFGALPEPTGFVMTATEGRYDAPTIWADPKPEATVRTTPLPKSQGGASLSVTPDKGTVGSKIVIEGQGFPANQPVKLTWATRSGQKITETGLLEGFEEWIKDFATANPGADGRFRLELTATDDFAGAHRLTATSGAATAEAYYSLYASIIEFTERAKVGDEIKIHMKGVGWTNQGKTYAIVYDNVYLGYGCSFSTRGDIDLRLPAAGVPGTHIIDLYPAVYEGKDPTPNIYSRPNLTYLNDHPGGVLPAFRLTLVVE
jgi:hypothetical protein